MLPWRRKETTGRSFALTENLSAEALIRQNIEAIKRGYESVKQGNFDGMLALIDPDVVVRDRPESPDPRTYHGHQGARDALAASDETFMEFEMEPEEFFGEGDYVVVVLTMRGTGRGSGVKVEERIAHQWKVRDGKAIALQVYSDPNDAVRDARASA
jgi:ketosteroid isomerase-like protein